MQGKHKENKKDLILREFIKHWHRGLLSDGNYRYPNLHYLFNIDLYRTFYHYKYDENK